MACRHTAVEANPVLVELILVNDGSTDRSTQIARDLAAADHRIRYVDHPEHANRPSR
jgi:glycosyltransferase involved in cell wall biosynthesis